MTATVPARRIVFTGDIFQVNHDGSPKMSMETHWLADLLRYQVSLASPQTPLDVVSWDASGTGFDGARFYALNGMTPSVENWARLEAASDITAAAASYLGRFFDGAMVIGNTMSTFQTRIFDAMKIPYLDFILHPARFLDDVCFGIRTNAPAMFTVLQAHHLPDEEVRLHAALHRAGLRRPPASDIDPDAGLFTAQHGIDKALVRDGRFCTIEDYRDDIAAFLGRHHRVYVKPHPYARQTVRILAFLRALARNADRIRVTEENLYALLSNSNVTEVCGISSCAVYEADYFGKAVTYLSNSRLTLCAPDDAFDPIRFVPVYDAFLNPGFWRRVLAGVCPVAAGRDIELPRKTSRLRNNLSLYWGYGHLDWEIPLRTIGLHPAPAPTQPAMSAWQNHDEGLLLQEAGRHEAAVECFAAALAEDESAERWHDWAAAQLAAGRPREAGDGRLMAARADARHTAAGRGFEAVARSGTVLVRSAHGTGTETIGMVARSLYRHGLHASCAATGAALSIPQPPDGLEGVGEAWAAAFVAVDAIPRPQLPRTMPAVAHMWIGDRLVARLLACHFPRVTRLDPGSADRWPSNDPLIDWLVTGGIAGHDVVEATPQEIEADGIEPCADSGVATDFGGPGPSAPVLLARLWLSRLRADREHHPSMAPWPLRTPATWRAAVALVRCCLNEGHPRLALALCAEYAVTARAQDPVVAAAFDYHAAHALRTVGRDADAWPLYERVRRAAATADVPAALLSGACYHLAVAARFAGRDGETEALLGECLRLQPNHGAARTLLDSVRSAATDVDHPTEAR